MSQEETSAGAALPAPRELTLSSPGPRTVPLTIDEARAIRARWLEEIAGAPKGSAVTKIDIGCRVWSPEALGALFGDKDAPMEVESSLSHLFRKFHATLEVLKVDDITATLPTDRGLQSLRCISEAFEKFEWPHLHTLNLNDIAIGSRGIQALASLWRIPALRHLHLQNVGLSDASIDMFVDHLLPPPPLPSASASVFEDDEQQQGASSDSPKRLVPFQTLSLGRNMLGVTGSRGVRRILENCYQLESLDYAGCRPLREGAGHVAVGLLASGSHNTIKVLNLNDGELRSGSDPDDPVHHMAQYLSLSTQLDTLVVSDSSLSSRGIKILLDAVLASPSSSTTLRHLDVGYNVDDDDDDDEDENGEDEDATSPPSIRCATTLAKAVMNLPNLRQLHLYNNDLKDDGVRIVVEALAARGAAAAAAADGPRMSPLDVLNLCENGLESVDMLLDNPIAGLKELRLADNLDLEDNMDDDQRERLNAMYPSVVWELDEVAFDVGVSAMASTTTPAAAAVGAAATLGSEPAKTISTDDSNDDDALAQALGGVHLG